jgi:hypothetical protein
VSAFRRGSRTAVIGREPLENHRGLTRAARDRVSAGQGQFSLLVAGPGFEPG